MSFLVACALGCGADGPTLRVQVNPKAGHGRINSLAVLEFAWAPEGARRYRPTGRGSDAPAPRAGQAGPGSTGARAQADEDDAAAAGRNDPSGTRDDGRAESAPPSSADGRERSESGDEDDDLDEDEDEEDDEDEDDDSDDDEDEDKDEDDEDDYDVDDDLPLYVLNAGATVADLLTSELMGMGHYTVRERSRLGEILTEHDLAATNIVDNSSYSLAGGVLGVDALVVGDVHAFSHRGGLLAKLSFSCRCIDTRGGDVIWSMSGEVNGAVPGTSALQAARELVAKMVEELAERLDSVEPPEAR